MPELEFTGERFVASCTGAIAYEHIHRYAAAAKSCVGKHVLDIACGEGYGAAYIARCAAEVIGVDIDGRSIEHARDLRPAESALQVWLRNASTATRCERRCDRIVRDAGTFGRA